jgi:hypothetical protein
MPLLTDLLATQLDTAFKDALEIGLHDAFKEFLAFQQTATDGSSQDQFEAAVDSAAKVGGTIGGSTFKNAAADAIEAFVKSGTVTTVVSTAVVVATTGTAVAQAGGGTGTGSGTGAPFSGIS